jgi:DnaJ-class molecular chaperone
MLCGGDGETTEFVTGQKTIGQKLIHKSTTVSGNEVYEVRDEKALTVDGKRTVSCKICKGNGSVKSGKKHQCPVCEGKGRVY